MILPSSVEHLENLSNSLQSCFIRLSKDEALWQSDLGGAMRHLTASVSQALDVERVGVWLLRDDRACIECSQLFLARDGRFESGTRIMARDYPAYFRAL